MFWSLYILADAAIGGESGRSSPLEGATCADVEQRSAVYLPHPVGAVRYLPQDGLLGSQHIQQWVEAAEEVCD